MSRSIKIVIGTVIVITVVVLSILTVRHLRKPLWKANAEMFSANFNAISGTSATIDDLSSFTPFEWDTILSFAPYTSEETITEAIGFQWEGIYPSLNEGMNQIVFLNDNEVVCYIDGYPDKYNIYFVFPTSSNAYYKLQIEDQLTFDMTLTERGIRILEYKE